MTDKVIHFSARHSRNPNDWAYSLDKESGRHTLSANGKGVKRRCGLIITRLAKESMGIGDLQKSLTYIDPAINRSDVKHAIKRLRDNGFIQRKKASNSYSCTEKGKLLWENATKLFR